MLPSFVRDYTLTAIGGAPDVLERLLADVAFNDPIWDCRPDPARFTLREITAHLADWNGVFLSRITRTRDEEEPRLLFQSADEVARANSSFEVAPEVSLTRFRESRAELVSVLRALEPEQLDRIGFLPGHPQIKGAVSIEAWNYAIVGHDGYHLQQVTQWLNAFQENK